MDHATAHERIADLALEADGLARLDASAAPDDRALVDHVRGCRACRAEIAASTRLSGGLRRALVDLPGASGVQPIAAPDSLRASVLAAAHAHRSDRVRAWAPLAWLRLRAVGVAAALTIAILGGIAGSQLERLASQPGSEAVAAVVATLGRVLAADGHRVVALRTPAGAAAGSVAWSRQDFAVLASSLSRPASGRSYRCWLQWAGRSASIGAMEFAGDTAYWTGSVGDWAAVAFDPGTRFIVTLEAGDGGLPPSEPTTPAVLVADLGS